jgi:tetratricopeptide (TPR) repeat protein
VLRRADLFSSLQLLVILLVAGCGAAPRPPPEPRLRMQAQEVETLGVRRYAQGDYSAAARHFADGARLRLSLDDAPAASRNRLQQAQSELALGQAQLALEHASQVREDSLQIQALLLQVQAQLTLGRVDAANPLLARLTTLCAASCAERGRLLLLQARAAWAGGDAALALTQAEAALPILRAQQEEREIANAWRLIAAARLKTSNTSTALVAAQAALDTDRQLALPEKIVRDWLLIGDIHRQSGTPEAKSEARMAYLRAQSVAQAAGLQELAKLAAQALMESSQ